MKLVLQALWLVLRKHFVSIMMAVIAATCIWNGLAGTGEASVKNVISGGILLVIAHMQARDERDGK